MLSVTAARVVAISVLAAVVAVLATRGWMLARPLRLSPLQAAVFGLNQVMVRVLWRARASGPLPVAPGQGAVIVCNHRGPIDPAFVYLTTGRVVHWMVAKEYWRNPLMAWFFRLSESISVSRDGIDTAAIKTAIRYARAGQLVGLFPEGRINTTDQVLLPGWPGAALVALKAEVPVIPCYISGSPNDGTFWGFLFMPAKVWVAVGAAIDTGPFCAGPNPRQAAEELTRLFLGRMSRLAGAGDFRPRLAGRFHKATLDAE